MRFSEGSGRVPTVVEDDKVVSVAGRAAADASASAPVSPSGPALCSLLCAFCFLGRRRRDEGARRDTQYASSTAPAISLHSRSRSSRTPSHPAVADVRRAEVVLGLSADELVLHAGRRRTAGPDGRRRGGRP